MEARYARRKTDQGGVMLRKHIFKDIQNRSVPQSGEIDIAATTTVQVTSEDSAHPIDNVFDCRRGPGGSRWVAEEPGEQTLLLAFDTPQTIHQIILEVEEPEVSRTQELWLSVSRDGGQTYRELRRQAVAESQDAIVPAIALVEKRPPIECIREETSHTGRLGV